MHQSRLMQQIAHLEDGAGRNRHRIQLRGTVLDGVLRGPVLDDGIDFGRSTHPQRGGGIACIAGQFRLADQLAHPSPLIIGAGAQQHPAVAGAIGVPG